MNKVILLPLLFCLTAISLFSQSNIQQPTSINNDGSAPAASAMLDVQATDRGVLVPRMTTLQRTAIASPATGLLVFDTNTNGFWFYNGTVWQAIVSGMTGTPSLIQDADGNTRVLTEKNPDEDIIRFDLAGTENMVLRKNVSGITRLELPNFWGNHFIGQGAGTANTTGSDNTANGINALFSNITGSYNTANGKGALFANTIGGANTATGSFALLFNTIGSGNTATGSSALFANIEGSWNTANGIGTLHDNTIGSWNTANGNGALSSNTTGNYNTANGNYALHFNTTGDNNTANGSNALRNNNGLWNTATGCFALSSNIAGSFNTANGSNALYSNMIGSCNTANGDNALYSNTFGFSNVAVGTNALFNNTVKSNLVAVGDSALYNNGLGATESWQAVNNTAVGSKALFSNTTGQGNTANGRGALFYNTTGSFNVANGELALASNTTGSDNTANGRGTLWFNTTGSFNTANGRNALIVNTTGSFNTANGIGALSSNLNGSENTGLGWNADVNTGNLVNATAIGARARVDASNSMVLGSVAGINGATSSVRVGIGETFPSHTLTVKSPNLQTLRLIGPASFGHQARFNFGDADYVYIDEPNDDIMRIQAVAVGVGRIPTTNRLEVEGDASKNSAGPWTANSDARLKKNITPLNSHEMLNQLLSLQGITYEWNDDKTGYTRPEGLQYGFTAQNIQEVFPTLVKKDELGYLQTAYSTYDAMIVEAMRALNDKIAVLEAEKSVLQSKVKYLEENQAAQLQKITAALQSVGILIEH